MELHQYILTEKSSCVIKDKEAAIILTKEKKGPWCKLLKNKVKGKLIWELLNISNILAVFWYRYFRLFFVNRILMCLLISNTGKILKTRVLFQLVRIEQVSVSHVWNGYHPNFYCIDFIWNIQLFYKYDTKLACPAPMKTGKRTSSKVCADRCFSVRIVQTVWYRSF